MTEYEVIFRGKRKDNGEWAYGFYWNRLPYEAHYIKVIDETGNLVGDYEIDINTFGEYTQRKDMHGNKIFLGDIVKTRSHDIKYTNRKVCVGFDNEGYPHYERETKVVCNDEFLGEVVRGYKGYYASGATVELGSIRDEIVGNIYDNPELLKQ